MDNDEVVFPVLDVHEGEISLSSQQSPSDRGIVIVRASYKNEVVATASVPIPDHSVSWSQFKDIISSKIGTASSNILQVEVKNCGIITSIDDIESGDELDVMLYSNDPQTYPPLPVNTANPTQLLDAKQIIIESMYNPQNSATVSSHDLTLIAEKCVFALKMPPLFRKAYWTVTDNGLREPIQSLSDSLFFGRLFIECPDCWEIIARRMSFPLHEQLPISIFIDKKNSSIDKIINQVREAFSLANCNVYIQKDDSLQFLREETLFEVYNGAEFVVAELRDVSFFVRLMDNSKKVIFTKEEVDSIIQRSLTNSNLQNSFENELKRSINSKLTIPSESEFKLIRADSQSFVKQSVSDLFCYFLFNGAPAQISFVYIPINVKLVLISDELGQNSRYFAIHSDTTLPVLKCQIINSFYPNKGLADDSIEVMINGNKPVEDVSRLLPTDHLTIELYEENKEEMQHEDNEASESDSHKDAEYFTLEDGRVVEVFTPPSDQSKRYVKEPKLRYLIPSEFPKIFKKNQVAGPAQVEAENSNYLSDSLSIDADNLYPTIPEEYRGPGNYDDFIIPVTIPEEYLSPQKDVVVSSKPSIGLDSSIESKLTSPPALAADIVNVNVTSPFDYQNTPKQKIRSFQVSHEVNGNIEARKFVDYAGEQNWNTFVECLASAFNIDINSVESVCIETLGETNSLEDIEDGDSLIIKSKTQNTSLPIPVRRLRPVVLNIFIRLYGIQGCPYISTTLPGTCSIEDIQRVSLGLLNIPIEASDSAKCSLLLEARELNANAMYDSDAAQLYDLDTQIFTALLVEHSIHILVKVDDFNVLIIGIESDLNGKRATFALAILKSWDWDFFVNRVKSLCNIPNDLVIEDICSSKNAKISFGRRLSSLRNYDIVRLKLTVVARPENVEAKIPYVNPPPPLPPKPILPPPPPNPFDHRLPQYIELKPGPPIQQDEFLPNVPAVVIAQNEGDRFSQLFDDLLAMGFSADQAYYGIHRSNGGDIVEIINIIETMNERKVPHQADNHNHPIVDLSKFNQINVQVLSDMGYSRQEIYDALEVGKCQDIEDAIVYIANNPRKIEVENKVNVQQPMPFPPRPNQYGAASPVNPHGAPLQPPHVNSYGGHPPPFMPYHPPIAPPKGPPEVKEEQNILWISQQLKNMGFTDQVIASAIYDAGCKDLDAALSYLYRIEMEKKPLRHIPDALKKYNQNSVRTLLDMGFNDDAIDEALEQCSTLEEAIRFLNGEGKFRCVICQEDKHASAASVVGCPMNHRFCSHCLARLVVASVKTTDGNHSHLPACPSQECRYILSLNEADYWIGYAAINCDPPLVSFQEADDLKAQLDKLYFEKAQRELGLIQCVCCNNRNGNAAVWFERPELDPFDTRTRIECPHCYGDFCGDCKEKPFHYGCECHEVMQYTRDYLFWLQQGRNEYLQQIARQDQQYQQLLRDYNNAKAQHENEAKEANDRFAEMEANERWKSQNCKLCPSCGRCINKLDGCDLMVCGENYHGGNIQNGCGARFNWSQAPPYVSNAGQAKNIGEFRRQIPQNMAQVKHEIYPGEALPCDSCRQPIIGVRLFCIHCPSFNQCLQCSINQPHLDGHVFKVMYRNDEF